MLQLHEGTLTNVIEIYEDTTGLHPDVRPPLKRGRIRSEQVYVWFCWHNHKDLARYRVYQQRWDALTPVQQADIRQARWGTPLVQVA